LSGQAHDDTEIRYFYWCATHGVLSSVPVDAFRAPPERLCQTCGAVAEVWVGEPRKVRAAIQDERRTA
jgi:hypothetical protein